MKWSIYIITNKINAKQYVGMTKSLKLRWHQHISEKSKHASFTGCKHSEETKAKICASNIATKALQKAQKMAEQGVLND